MKSNMASSCCSSYVPLRHARTHSIDDHSSVKSATTFERKMLRVGMLQEFAEAVLYQKESNQNVEKASTHIVSIMSTYWLPPPWKDTATAL
jgi:hypothetical protein